MVYKQKNLQTENVIGTVSGEIKDNDLATLVLTYSPIGNGVNLPIPYRIDAGQQPGRLPITGKFEGTAPATQSVNLGDLVKFNVVFYCNNCPAGVLSIEIPKV